MEIKELEIIKYLDAAVNKLGIRKSLDEIIQRVEKHLEDDKNLTMAWEPIPLDFYGVDFPEFIKSSWVFILRKNLITGAERHPNSHQRMMSYRGGGDFQTKADSNWQSNFLESSLDCELNKRWISIPTNVWHQGVVGNENWAVVSFQTVKAEELIEERPDEKNENNFLRKKYIKN